VPFKLHSPRSTLPMASAISHPADLTGPRTHARSLLALFLLAAAFFVSVTLSPLAQGFADAPSRGPGDLGLYAAEVARMQDGVSYHDAAAEELVARGYPTRSVFNWRTPLPVWLVAQLPDQLVACVLLVALGMALVLLSFTLLSDEGGASQGLLGVVFLSGALLPCFLGPPVLLSELWSGVLLAISAVCFGLQRRCPAIAAGLAALFFRELAAPYVAVCLALTLSERRFRELGYWALGLIAYGVFYYLHVQQVLPRIGAEATAHEGGWIRFGGAGFLIATAQLNAYLLLLPQWVTGIYLAAALLGAATWNTAGGRLIAFTVATYAVAFSIAGNEFNQYWGCQVAPLLCIVAARAPSVLRQAWNAATGSHAPLGTARGV
jgi:hypothetical protein